MWALLKRDPQTVFGRAVFSSIVDESSVLNVFSALLPSAAVPVSQLGTIHSLSYSAPFSHNMAQIVLVPLASLLLINVGLRPHAWTGPRSAVRAPVRCFSLTDGARGKELSGPVEASTSGKSSHLPFRASYQHDSRHRIPTNAFIKCGRQRRERQSHWRTERFKPARPPVRLGCEEDEEMITTGDDDEDPPIFAQWWCYSISLFDLSARMFVCGLVR